MMIILYDTFRSKRDVTEYFYLDPITGASSVPGSFPFCWLS